MRESEATDSSSLEWNSESNWQNKMYENMMIIDYNNIYIIIIYKRPSEMDQNDLTLIRSHK